MNRISVRTKCDISLNVRHVAITHSSPSHVHTEIDGVRKFIEDLPVLHLVVVVEGIEHLNSCTVQVPSKTVGF